MHLNEEFLSRHLSSWYDPSLRLQSGTGVDAEEREGFIESIRQFLVKSATGKPLVIKEPRITALAEYWFEATRRAGLMMKLVIPVRHPDEVAASLISRDKLSFELASTLYVKYNLLAERHSRPFPRAFVEYQNLLKDWRQEISRVSEAISIELNDREEESIDNFLRRDLHRQKSDGQPANWAFNLNWVNSIYATLSAAARGTPCDRRILDEIYIAFRSSERTFRLSWNEFLSRNGRVDVTQNPKTKPDGS